MTKHVCTALMAAALWQQVSAQPLFEPVKPASSGVTMVNLVPETPSLNIVTYEYFYNGAGIGVADFNSDGLPDLFISGNLQPARLYLNRGNWQFEDVTRSAGVAGRPGWKTGVSVADVNGDGWPDIYLCYSGDVESKFRRNQLFINDGKGGFTEQAEKWGVDDAGHSTMAVFFDYDRDGDLDLYVLNHNVKSLRNFDAAYVKKMVDADAGDRLYRNDGGRFTDVSREAGIISNPLGYGLGIAVSDVNGDGWPDLYVSNDYVEEDYLYLNNGDGTFTESLKSLLGHISNFSMGSDIADINNDGWPDIFTLDMLPADNKRQKLLYAPDNYETYYGTLRSGFHHQLMRNMLHLNQGPAGGFSEIGQFSGISNTDWSWAAIFADLNNNGRKDLVVTNGYGRDMINRDFMKFYANERLKHLRGETDSRMFRMLQGIQTTPLSNYLFENLDGLRFADRSEAWGFGDKTLSNGAAVADLDGDGDLDLIINHLNDTVGLFRNQWAEQKRPGNWIQLRPVMQGANRDAIGARVELYCGGQMQMQEQFPARGFQSSMLGPLHFGLPEGITRCDSVRVRWPDGKWQVFAGGLSAGKLHELQHDAARTKELAQPNPATLFRASQAALPYRHAEQPHNDFKIQPLMPNMVSYNGPRMSAADINGDGLDDLFICGAAGQPGAVLLQQADGRWRRSEQPALEADAAHEDTDAVWADFDGDGALDLYVVSGGFRFPEDDPLYADRLYLNRQGKFVRAADKLPALRASGSCVAVADVNGDGAMDIFVGSRVIPGRYPETPDSYLLLNDGKGRFTVGQQMPLGMVTDAVFDHSGSSPELLVAGEWMPLMSWTWENNRLTDRTESRFGRRITGWWNRLHLTDIDDDGKMDLVAGNWGLNSQLKPQQGLPVELYYADFDDNGSVDPLLCYPIGDKNYPMASRDEMTDQMFSLRQKFPTYDSYSEARLEQILNPDQVKMAKRLEATEFRTLWFRQAGPRWELRELPAEAQFSPVYAIATADVNGDGQMDIILGGNVEHTRIKIGKIDANPGLVLLNDGRGAFRTVEQSRTGLMLSGCIRDMQWIRGSGRKMSLVMTVNGGLPLIYELK